MNRLHHAAAAVAVLAVTSAPVVTHAAGTLSLYADANYGVLSGTRTTTGWWNITLANNDRLSSAKNQTNWTAAFWHNTNRGAPCWTQAPYTNDPSFNWWDDNQVSSFGLDRPC